ncbi:InlB B-repeat-containing protein [Bacillus sp. RG28]|uniref:InlB B-repeat-containing protein n=1 Tax=Gottfriedia endophytica TaxID=2820819 RepID=A0A940NSZ4_9BACI|nr:InlB B-repeat-containing protein [Gottfriedia endophytica]MBP0726487.1 InlB B-repeat-containing protein [Gottfriedia endophytica]
MKQRKKMSKRKIWKVFSIFALSAMLSNVVLPLGLKQAFADTNLTQQTASNGTFTADEVNRILDGLTTEQKANINKLTGADNAQKIHVDQKDLHSSKNINVIVQFKEDPAKIQIIKQSLANGGATLNRQDFAAEYSDAQNKVEESHTKFKTFVNTQPKTTVVGGKSVNTTMSISREYSEAFNGVALSLPSNLVEKLSENPEVASIWSAVEYTVADQDSTSQSSGTSDNVGKPTSGLTLLGIDKLQAEGNTGIIKSGPRAGKRVKVGVLDTGIDYNHPDLKAVYKGGHDFVNNSGIDSKGNVIYVDDNDPMETTYNDWKAAKSNPDPTVGPPPGDYKQYITSHGTHVSGTIAANTTDNNNVYSANGVAPNVDLYAYRVLGPGGHGTSDSVLNGIDQAVKDHMDVINLSLGASVNNPLYPTSIAINNATLSGVVCDVAAGNSGPGTATVGSPGTSPLAITVGASTIPEDIPVMTINNGSASYKARLFGKNFAQADDEFKGKTIPIVDVGLGSVAAYDGINMSGKLALVKRGGEYLQTKMANAKKAGAEGMIIWDNTEDSDNQGYIASFLGVSMDNVYSISLTQAEGQALSDEIQKDPKSASITFPSTLDPAISKNGDELASFSSTGPVSNWSIKPDVVAPGVDISSTAPYDIWEPQDNTTHDYKYDYQIMSGTSMATPHVAGISALVLAAHPDYTPADVKAALMNTAKDINTDSKTYSVYQVGAGRVDPARAINADTRIQVLDKAITQDNLADASTLHEVDNLTGSMFFGFKGRGEGSTNGSDDVIASKDFNVINQGTSSKTFNVSTEYISTKFAGSNKVCPGTGNDVNIDFTVDGKNVSSINVGGESTVKAMAKITVPSNSLEGTYEGYISLVNSQDSSESYRIPFTITVAEKGINKFQVAIKAAAEGNLSAYYLSVNNEMENLYIAIKDKDGKYIGIANTLSNGSNLIPGVQYGPLITLFRGFYLPFTKTYDGTYDQSGISNKVEVLKEGAYSLELIATGKDGKRYTAEDTVYVDGTPPTMKMDQDSNGGIYEIDTTGYLPGQEIKGFYGTVYDSNIDVMKNNGETSVPSPKDGITPVPVDQALNSVIGYQDSMFPTVYFNTDAKGRFHFGVTAEDVANKLGSEFYIDPVDYSGESDGSINGQTYYFIKKGNPYVTLTSSNGIDAGLGNEDKLVIDANKPFKTTITTKYGVGMTGGKFMLNSNSVYEFSNIRLTEEYKNYLIGKGIDPTKVLSVSQPYVHPIYQKGKTTDVTISNIGPAGALDHDMPIIEADVTYNSPDPITGPFEYQLLQANLTLSGEDTRVAWFPTNVPYVRQNISVLRGQVAAESFARNNVNNQYPQFTVDSGAKVTAIDDKGKKFTTDQPTSFNNTMAYTFINPYYALTMDVSDKPYSVEASVPGHFKGYEKTPVIGENKFGYQSGTVKDIRGLFPILLGGDVNGDNVIDMKDLLKEIDVYYQYKNLNNFNNPANTLANKTAFLNTNRDADIYWIKPSGFGYGIDYNDFYFIFKNFGQQNQSAIDAGVTVPTAQLTVDQDKTITTDFAGSITLNAGDTLQQVMQKLNFTAPSQQIVTTPKLQDLQNGATISLVPTSTVFVDDVVWRKSITTIMLGTTDVTNLVNISPAYMYYDQNGVQQTMPSKITFPGSLFPTATNYTMTVKATGYQDVTKAFTVSAVPIPTPVIPIITDPTVAHIGQDLTLTFPENANWRNGINKVIVTTNTGKSMDISNLINPDTNQKYYDISMPGKITFNAKTFMTDSTLDPNNGSTYNQATVNPGGKSYLPQLYRFTIGSIGTDGTVYPDSIAGYDPVYTGQQPVGFTINFDSQGGTVINPMAVGYKADSSRSNGPSSDLVSYMRPAPTKPGYKFLGWFNEPTGTTLWDPSRALTADKTVYAKWQMNTTQSYSPVDKANPNGLKFDGSNGSVSGIGWVLGEGDLKINIPDYLTNVSWLTGKDKIAKIEAKFYAMKSDGTTETTPTKYTLDPSTYDLSSNESNGILSFKTATHDQAVQAGQSNLGEKFAFSEMPTLANFGAIKGYELTLTSTSGENVVIPNIQLGYRRHIDLNAGTLKNANDLYFADMLVNGKTTAPNMSTGSTRVTNGNLTISNDLYLDAASSSDKKSDITTNPKVLTDNSTFYLSWIKVPPTVNKDVVGNIVGSDITLTFTDVGTWKNNIKAVMIGSKTLELNKDYTVSNNNITLKASLFTNGQKVNVTIVSEGYKDVVVIDQVIGYTVTFESNGGDPVPSQIVDRNASKPIDPTKVGYKFYGWYMDQNLTIPYDFDNIVTKPITLYAKYALAGSFVTPDTTDNALGNNIVLEYVDKDWANAITGIAINGSAVDGSKFDVDKVNRTITLDNSLFTRVKDYTITIKATDYSDVTFVQKVVNGYIVHFVLPGDAPAELKEGTKDQIVARRITTPTVHGYDLTWFADEECTIPWDFTNSIYSAKTIYGKWSPTKFTVIFDRQDGGLVQSKTAEYKTTITAPNVPTRPGYTFDGWYKDAEGKNAWDFATDKVTENTILYAKWSSNSYTVSFNSEGGSAVDSKTVVFNTTVGEPTAPTRTGYTFDGWYKDVEGKTAWNFATDKVTENTILYAKWSSNNSINSYTVSFNSQGGSVVDSKTVIFNTTVGEPTAPTRPGYTFVGWYKDAEGQTAWNFATDKVTENTILYAKWSSNSYTVSFNSQGGSVVDSKTVIFNTTVGEPAAPTRPGYTFVGWYKDAEGKNAWNFATDKVTENTILYAKWSSNSYTVSFNSQGGSVVESKTVIFNTTVGEPVAPTRSGYTFVGWYKDAEGKNAWNFTTDKVTANTILYARWSSNSYTVSFNSQGGSVVDSKTVIFNTTVGEPTAPTRKGYTFVGWYKDTIGQTAWNFATDKVTSSVTLYAKWLLIGPVINPIDDNDRLISGKTEANATVVVKNKDIVVATGKADAEGIYSIEITPQKAGTVLTVIVKDVEGNQSEASSITILDRTAPKAPIINLIADNDTKITGITEANAIIIVKINNIVVATGKADSKGLFSIKIKQQKAGTQLSVYAKDTAGNQSAATNVKVLDKTAPNAPKISSFILKNKNQIQIKGTAEANSTIVVKIGNKVVTNVKVSSNGTFTVNLSKVGKGKNTITLYAVDKAGNKGSVVNRSVIIK